MNRQEPKEALSNGALPFKSLSLGTIAIALTNLAPLLGIIFWDWAPFDVVFLYWLENIVIGVFVVLRMLVKPNNAPAFMIGGLFLATFFCFHYGFFTYGHGFFILSIFQESQQLSFNSDIIQTSIELMQNGYLQLALLGLMVGHLIDYLQAYRHGEIDSASEEMTKPYQRIIILHITIIAGGFLSLALNQDFAMALLLVAIKLFFDLKKPSLFKTKQKQQSLSDNFKISPNASEQEIKAVIRQKLAKPELKINKQTYQYNNVTEMVNSQEFSRASKMLKWFMPKRMHKLYQQVLLEMVEEEKSAQ